MKYPIAYPPKNLKEPAINTHLQVEFKNSSLVADKKAVSGDFLTPYGFGEPDALGLNLPLSGSIMKIIPKTPAPPPIIPIKR